MNENHWICYVKKCITTKCSLRNVKFNIKTQTYTQIAKTINLNDNAGHRTDVFVNLVFLYLDFYFSGTIQIRNVSL